MHMGGGWGRVERSIKWSHRKAIKHEKENPSRYSDNPKYPLKRIWPKPLGST